ncbi:glycosyltransferase [Pseudarthrobacter sp. BRE9]|uniref:glycosyltransferase n=1 Tax=Pseudarthrobacter sp. BRE9 TaxID=2962582 RepID=UPI00288168A2|nr:glycosyltransferase [Pseudarthrobacter sp. BRE9]MDT0167629.1 glycosyltransferase [Pseudarthrobacter sp. BRE9]
MTQGEENARVAAVIAAYNPDKKIIDVFRAVVGQVDLVVVVDDKSNDSAMPVFDELRSLGAEVMHSPKNAGIAGTLNAGISRSAAFGKFDYYLTLDQDSIPDEDYVSRALKTERLARDLNMPVGFVSAATYNNSPVLGNRPLLGFEQPFDPWQSGMLIPRSTFDAVGGLDERLVIDAVDSEFTLRVRKAGLAVLCGIGCNMSHSLGQQSTVSLWGKKRLFTYHSPVRVYYISRNNVIIFFRYFLTDPIWVGRKGYYELINHTRRILFSKNRGDILRATYFGFRDALLFRNGIIRGRDMQKLN